jgi:hypothetical protein
MPVRVGFIPRPHGGIERPDASDRHGMGLAQLVIEFVSGCRIENDRAQQSNAIPGELLKDVNPPAKGQLVKSRTHYDRHSTFTVEQDR